MTNSYQEDTSSSLERDNLIKLRLRAMRAGVWFRRLSRIDRALVDLTIRVAKDRIYGVSLVHRLLTVASKLEGLFESKLSVMARQVGMPLASKLSCLAMKWGNVAAKFWIDNSKFARYLAVVELNAY